MRATKRQTVSICWALAATLCAGRASSGDYHLVLGVDQRADYDDNVDFTRQNEIGATSYILTPNARLDGKTERWDLGVNLDLPFERYSEERLNSDDQNLQVVSKRRLERGELDLAGGILRDSTHRSEEDSSGVVARNAQRRVLDTFSGSWTRNVGEREQFSVGGNAQTADYAESSGFHDYGYYGGQGSWTHVINQRMSTQVSVFDSHLKSEVDPGFLCLNFISGEIEPCLPGPGSFVVAGPVPLPDSQTDTVGIQGGVTRVFNERWRGNFALGWRHVETTSHELASDLGTTEISDTSKGKLGSASITYTGQRLEATTTISEDLTPSGIGAVLERRQLREELAYRLHEKLFLRLNAVAYDNESTTESVPFKREFYSVRPQVEWRFRRNWSLLGGIEVRGQKQCRGVVTEVTPEGEIVETSTCGALDQLDRATSNSVFLSLTYSSEPFRVFR